VAKRGAKTSAPRRRAATAKTRLSKAKGQRHHAPASAPTTSGQWLIVTRPQLAELLGVHPDTVTDYTRGGMPVITMGGHGVESAYDVAACLTWWRSKQGKNAKDNAQTRALEASAALNELKLKEQQGELVSREDVIASGQAYTKGWTAMLRALPRQCVNAGLLDRAQEGELLKLITPLLVEIAGWKTLKDIEASIARAEAPAA